ncbi:MAG: trigger factor [Firmicutes bacterium]|nr:trigger factor [Bacillota bacterium]MBQ3964350.1 trigger factor [Bacillota bacterium]
MKNTFISREGNDAKFTMEFTAEEFESAKVKVYQANKGKFQIDGFRKGKAPRSIIEKRYGDGVFAEDAINDLLSENYGAAIDELALEVVDSPRVEFSPIEKGKGFTATITVEVYPEVEIKDYKGVEVEDRKQVITDEDVDAELENLRHRNSRMIAVDRPVKDGDSIILDYKGFVGDDQFEGGTADGFNLVIGSGTFIPGFEEQLVGAEKEKEVDVKVTFPEEYHSEDLAGKEAVFKCVVHDIKEEELPELDDEFVKDISELDTLDEFREFTAGRLQSERDNMTESIMKDDLLDKVCEANDFDVPDAMVETEVDNMMQEYDQQLRAQGMDLATYIQYMGRTVEEFREDMKMSAFRRVKNRMVLRAIANQENIEASEEEVEKQLEEMGQQYHIEIDKLKEMLGEQNIKAIGQDVRIQKAIDLMFEEAKIVPKKEKPAKEEKADEE